MGPKILYNLKNGINKSSPIRLRSWVGLTVEFDGIILFLFLLFSFSSLIASQLPDGFAETRIATGLDPVDLQIAPDGRVFVTEKNGEVRIIKNGSLLATPFMRLSVDNFNERGLMGIAFDPDFSSNQYIYVYYTVPGADHNRVSRFKANGDVVVAGSEKVLIDIDPLSAGNHNGGSLFFKGGKLFITTGDGANSQASQSLSSLLGKVLRINADGSIPTDNPLVSSTKGKYRAIWALGLRNPFKATVQPGTGRIFINDVGQSTWEEINEGVAGKNYGWPGIEGKRVLQSTPANYQDPFFVYGRLDGCSITGGTFYNPTTNQFPAAYRGKYLYADYCNGYIRTLDPATGAVASFATGVDRPLDIEVASDGTLYYIARGGQGGGSQTDNTSSDEGAIWRVQYTGSGVPTISANPVNRTAPVGGSATFTVSASGNGTLSYQWQRNGTVISGATAASYTISNLTLSDSGATFRCVVSNASGSVTSASATLTVNANQAPVATITSPLATWLYQGGDVISYAATATDPEDGALPDNAFTWKIDFHHDTHTHPALEATSGASSGSFQIPRTGETAATVWYRIYLTVTDSKGQASTTYRDVYPAKSTITLTSNPAGLQLKLDGQSVTTPYSFTGVVGMTRSIEAVSPQTLSESTYQFGAWSDGGAALHEFNTPAANTTYQASFTSLAAANGLTYAYYEGVWDQLPNFNELTPVKTGTTDIFSLATRARDDYFAYRFTGNINLATSGKYTFYTASDDGSQLYIDNQLVVENGGLHGLKEQSGSLDLSAGRHAIEVRFFEKGGYNILDVSYEGPGLFKQIIPASAFSTGDGPSEGPDSISGSYYLTAKHSGKLLDIENSLNDEGAKIIQLAYDGTLSQLWTLEALDNGFYKVVSARSGKALDVSGTKNGDDIFQYSYAGKESQQWKITALGDGYYSLEARNSGRIMEVTSSSQSNGAQVQQWVYQGKDTQKWKLEKADAARLGLADEPASQTLAIQLNPNPATDKVTVTCQSASAGKAEVIVTDALAGVRISRSVELKAGSNGFDLPVAGLANGLYFVKVIQQGKAVTAKVMISK